MYSIIGKISHFRSSEPTLPGKAPFTNNSLSLRVPVRSSQRRSFCHCQLNLPSTFWTCDVLPGKSTHQKKSPQCPHDSWVFWGSTRIVFVREIMPLQLKTLNHCHFGTPPFQWPFVRTKRLSWGHQHIYFVNLPRVGEMNTNLALHWIFQKDIGTWSPLKKIL